MIVIVGADHAGYKLKEALKDELQKMGHRVIDVGTHSAESVDYPEYSEKVALAVLQARGRRGILVCGSGVGASVAANKLPGIRAGLCHDTYSAHQGVEHDDMNVLVLGGRVIGEELAKDLMRAYLGARFTGETRHRRRLREVAALEKKYGCGAGAPRARRG
jgi:ribose 5-phosphate isomerase B